MFAVKKKRTMKRKKRLPKSIQKNIELCEAFSKGLEAGLAEPAAVESCCGEAISPERLRHSYCVAGIDLSQTTDLTARCAVGARSAWRDLKS